MKKVEFYLTENDYNWFFQYALADGESVNDYIYDVVKQYKTVSNAISLVNCIETE